MQIGDTVLWRDVPVGALFYSTHGAAPPDIGLRADARSLAWVWEYYFQGFWRVSDSRSGPWDPKHGSSRPGAVVLLALDVKPTSTPVQFKRLAFDGATRAGFADELSQDRGPFAPDSWPKI